MSDHRSRELADWGRVRRYAVPRWMIEKATERRLAGDWAGACAAARVRVGLDLSSIARRHGSDVAGAVRDDLLHFAPDLLRWHLPRLGHGRSTIATHMAIVLAEYGGGNSLHVILPTMRDGPQHLTLAFGGPAAHPTLDSGEVDAELGAYRRTRAHSWARSRHLWDARRTGELLERCGGGDRAPFFHPDGTPRAEDDPPDTDPAAHTERVTVLQDRGEIEAAFAAAGLDLDLAAPDLRRYYRAVEPRAVLAALPMAPTRLARELRLLGGDRWRILLGAWPTALQIEGRERPRLRLVDLTRTDEVEPLLDTHWRRLPDLDLLRAGRITPEQLHPLVRSALFPARPAPDGPVGPPDPTPPEPVRVRCRGEWHQVRVGGELRIPHTEEEWRRESALRALGGATAGCFAARQAWTGQGGRLPRALRAQRQDLFLRAQHGDTPGVLALLDAGADPAARDGRKRTLLHMLHMLDHERLLPRLLDAGLDLEAKDQHARTPLHMAVGDHGSPELVRALVDAGARIDVVDDLDWSLLDLIRRFRRTDLGWLRERLKRECPDLGGG